jgi:thioester reductase-like protein
MTKRIFLTGANGFLGSYLARALALEGWDISCLLRSQKGELAHERLHKALSGICADAAEIREVLARCSVVEGQLDKPRFGMSQTDYDLLAGGLDSVLHCAAMTTFDPSHAQRQWKVNVEGTEQVTRLAADCKPSYGYHYISTAYVAGNRTDTAYENELDCGQGFFNGYESSKFEAEKIINRYRDQGLATTVYRPGIIVGDSSSGQTVLFNSMYIFFRFFDSARRTFDETDSRGRIVTPIRINGNLAVTKNFVHVDYIVDTTMAIFKNPAAHGGVYHLTQDDPPTLALTLEVMEEVLGITGIRCVDKSDFEKMPPTEMEEYLLDQSTFYAPYLVSEPRFDRSAIKKVLPPETIPPCPPMDKAALTKLFTYALESKWGRRKIKQN